MAVNGSRVGVGMRLRLGALFPEPSAFDLDLSTWALKGRTVVGGT